ncbi:hypothetical protein FQN54_000891 [Arachnomyces sp. PD_36]|nr:hypothetical protein FQN54_000891 [Arachnomyces sp. PD_36]
MSELISTKGKYYDAGLLRDVVRLVAKDGPDLKKWEIRLNWGDEDAWLALLFLILENLKSLDLSYGVSPYIFRAVEAIVRPDPEKEDKIMALQSLESINFWTEHKSLYTFCARGFAPFYLLPSMKVFRSTKVQEEQDYSHERNPEYDSDNEESNVWEKYLTLPYPDSNLELPARTSPVREIVLEQSNCRHGFAEFITACAGLERFEYQHSNEAVHQNLYFNLRPRAFYRPLLTQRETLRVLRFNDLGVTKNLEGREEDWNGTGTQETIESWFGSLVEFTALRDIEVLCLAKVDREDYELVVRELMELLAGGFISLRKVIVQLYQLELFDGEEEECYEPVNFGVPQFAVDAFKRVGDSCLEKGVEFCLADDGEHQIVKGTEVVVDTRATMFFSL